MRPRTTRPRRTQARLRWLDSGPKQETGSQPDMENGSISSEEDIVEDGLISPTMAPVDSNILRQDIWERADVLHVLRSMPGAEELEAALVAGDNVALEAHPKAKTTGVLLAAWRGDAICLSALLKSGASPHVLDTDGRTPLHLACCAGAEDCVGILLRNGASPQVWDSQHYATPLHCAASVGNLGCIRRLVAAGADVNAGLSGSRSALHYAVQSNVPDCVAELLKSGACPNTPQIFTETPLHVAAAMGYATCTKLLLEHGADVRVQFGPEKTTALHLAAVDGNAECARLLLDAGAYIDATNHRLQTPLHLAALAQSAETLELLLRRGATADVEDTDGRTPLHSAIVKVCHSCECVRLLLDAGATVNKADAFGYTPLHIAALNEFSNCVFLLLRYGADATARTNGGVSALSFIVRRTPDVLPRFQAQLDASVKLHEHEIGDVDCELQLDFRILVPNVEKGESGLLLAFIEVGQRHVLNHPLCKTFLFLKWRRIRKFFLLSLLFHAVFVLVYSAYVVGTFLNVDGSNGNISIPIQISGYILLTLTSVLLCKELFQMAHSWSGYIRHWENWLQLQIIASACATCIPNIGPNTKIDAWQHHVAAVGIFLTWLELMMLVGRFPMFGLYVQMFTTVAVNFAKFLLAYCCLLVAFSLSFSVLFPKYDAFKHVLWSLMKTLVMMSGELEYEDIFSSTGHTVLYPVTAHLVFLAFVLLVTVILTNLLVGLAVSDIQGLQQSAGLDRLVRQAELVAHLESMLFSRLLLCLPSKLLALCHRSALLLTTPYHWVLHIRPNDPREHRAPRELIDAAYRLVAGRRERTRRGVISRRSAVDDDGFHAGRPQNRRYVGLDEDYVSLSSARPMRATDVDEDYLQVNYFPNKRSTKMEDEYTQVNYVAEKRSTCMEDAYMQVNYITDKRHKTVDIPLNHINVKNPSAMVDDYTTMHYSQSKHAMPVEDDYRPLSCSQSKNLARMHIDSIIDKQTSQTSRRLEDTMNQILSQLSSLSAEVKSLDSSTKHSIKELSEKLNNRRQT